MLAHPFSKEDKMFILGEDVPDLALKLNLLGDKEYLLHKVKHPSAGKYGLRPDNVIAKEQQDVI